MKKIVVVFHGGCGHTRKVAEAVAEVGGGALLTIGAESNLPKDSWRNWPLPMPSSSVRPPAWAA